MGKGGGQDGPLLEQTEPHQEPSRTRRGTEEPLHPGEPEKRVSKDRTGLQQNSDFIQSSRTVKGRTQDPKTSGSGSVQTPGSDLELSGRSLLEAVLHSCR